MRPVGSTSEISIDVRVIAATNRELDKAVADNLFREDLYYRLNVIPIRVPPLRERREDIPLLANHFLKKVCEPRRTQHSPNAFSIARFALRLRVAGKCAPARKHRRARSGSRDDRRTCT